MDDVWRLVDQCAGVAGVDPRPLTLRELLAMAEARQRHDWSLASSVMALLASVHRDPKKRRAFKPSDFDPFARKADAGQPIPADVRVLKDVFIRKTAETDAEQGGSHEG